MNQQSLQRLSVNDCFGQFVWHGEVTPLLPLVDESSRPQTWQTTCVQSFFRQYNWSGRTVKVIDTAQPQSFAACSLRLPMQEFWDCFVWGGQPEIAPQPTAVETSPETNAAYDFKLSKFSNLF